VRALLLMYPPGMPSRFLLYSLREYPGLFLSHMRHGPGNNNCCSGLLHIPAGGCHFQRSQTPKAQPPHVAPVDMHTTRPLVGGLNEWEPISIAGIRPSKGVSAPIPCGNTHACFHKPTFPLATLLRRLIFPIYSFIPLIGILPITYGSPCTVPTNYVRQPMYSYSRQHISYVLHGPLCSTAEGCTAQFHMAAHEVHMH
jgi:hypothetical protein